MARFDEPRWMPDFVSHAEIPEETPEQWRANSISYLLDILPEGRRQEMHPELNKLSDDELARLILDLSVAKSQEEV